MAWELGLGIAKGVLGRLNVWGCELLGCSAFRGCRILVVLGSTHAQA